MAINLLLATFIVNISALIFPMFYIFSCAPIAYFIALPSFGLIWSFVNIYVLFINADDHWEDVIANNMKYTLGSSYAMMGADLLNTLATIITC